MDWNGRKKLAALFSERSLASGFTLGVVVSLFILLLLTLTPSSSSSLFPWFNNLSFQNYSSSSSSVQLEPVKDANVSVQSNNSLTTQFPNATFSDSATENVPLEGINGGNLTFNNGSSNGSSLSSSIVEDAQLGQSNSRNWGREGGNGSLVVENLPSWNSTMNYTHQGFSPPFNNNTGVSSNSRKEIVPLYNTTGVSSNGTSELIPRKENITFPNNSRNASVDASSAEKGTTLEQQPRGTNNASLDKEAPVVLKDQEKSSNYSLDNKTKTKDIPLQNQHCNIFDGKWVRDDESDPLYPPGSCPHIDDDFNCFKNGRPDQDFLKWRWQPNQCDIPRLNATDFLQRLRGKRLLFVGDSLNRNMWESLVCILRQAVPDKTRVFEVSGKKRFKMSGYYSFRFKDYKCYVDFARSTFLVKEVVSRRSDGAEDEKLRLDIMDDTTVAYQKADIIVFNTGHWWTHEKTSKGKNYYQEGDHVYPVLKVLNAYEKALTTWARWIDANINPKKTQIVFRSYSLTHFRGGQWNSGGQCHRETSPIFNESFLSHYPSKNKALEHVLQRMKTPVIYLNISRLTDYRKDAHPSIYRKRYNSPEELMAAERSQDCSHWCLPGVPDSWNQLLYASLLLTGTGSWRN